MIEPGKLNGYLVAIKEELRKAEGKHPKFCDEITGKSTKTVKKALANLRLENDVPPFYADSILHEEICEHLNYSKQSAGLAEPPDSWEGVGGGWGVRGGREARGSEREQYNYLPME